MAALRDLFEQDVRVYIEAIKKQVSLIVVTVEVFCEQRRGDSHAGSLCVRVEYDVAVMQVSNRQIAVAIHRTAGWHAAVGSRQGPERFLRDRVLGDLVGS